MLIVYIDNGPGWEPVGHMANLAAELFDAELLVLNTDVPKSWKKLEFLLPKSSSASETCLLISPGPDQLLSLSLVANWRKRFKFIAAWVIDSFWIDRIPKIIKHSSQFDHLFITSGEDVADWEAHTKIPTTFLPWGTDALRLGGKNPERPWDLARIGRQPTEWDDDSATKQMCSDKGLSFHGRIKGYDTPHKNQEMLMKLYKESKFLLAFSNIANPTNYTHPNRQYITARWTDALASGAIVAGIPPKEPSIDHLLWEGATLDLKSIKIKDGLEVISEATKDWHPGKAELNYKKSLERLDWRWRFSIIADTLNLSPKLLNHEIELIKQTIEST